MSQPTNKQSINWQEVGEEIVALVRGLLRLDTTF